MPTLFQKAAKKSSIPDQDANRRHTIREVLDALDKVCREESTVDDRDGRTYRWMLLAERLNVSLLTVQFWAKAGHVPLRVGKQMEEKFGTSRVVASELALSDAE